MPDLRHQSHFSEDLYGSFALLAVFVAALFVARLVAAAVIAAGNAVTG